MNKFPRFSTLDYLRFIAASAVMYSHSYVLTGREAREPVIYILGKTDAASLAVNFFFFLSGYLMFGALPRSENQIKFLTKRLARIVPGLTICIFLTMVLSACITTYSIHDYLKSWQTIRYLKNVIFLFNPYLPGVFETNPYPLVANGSLWTLFYEMACYFLLSFLIYFNQRARVLVLYTVAGVCIIYLSVAEHMGPTFWGNISRLTLFFSIGYIFCSHPK